jgi:hypothetical protein
MGQRVASGSYIQLIIQRQVSLSDLLYDVRVPNKESEILTTVPGINEVLPVGWCTRRFPPKVLNWDKTSKLVEIRGWLIAIALERSPLRRCCEALAASVDLMPY